MWARRRGSKWIDAIKTAINGVRLLFQLSPLVQNSPIPFGVHRALWLQHGILLGMRCTRPRVVPVPFQQTHVTSLDLTVWASVPREIKVSNATRI